MNPDEDIVLNIGANTVDVEAALHNLQQEIQHAFESSNSKVRGYGIQLDRISERMEKLADKMRAMYNVPIKSDAYVDAEKRAAELFNKLYETKNLMQQMADAKITDSAEWNNVIEYARQLRAEYDGVVQDLNRMTKDPQHYALGQNTEKFKNMAREFNRLNMQAGIVSQKMRDVENSANSTERSVRRLGRQGASALSSFARFIKDRLGRNMRNAREETRGFGNDAKASFKKALSFLIRYGIGMASLFRLYRRLRVWTKEAMQTMGKAIPEIGQQILDVSNAAIQLKNSLATVAQPIFTYLLPAIQTVISALVTAMNTLANFFAMLTGQGYIYKAAKGNKKLADSISGAGNAAKEAKEEIAEYDKLIVLDQPNAGGGAGGAGGAADDVAGSFEKVDGQMTHFIQDIQRMWDVFKQAWQNKGKRVMDAWHRALGSVKQLITDIWHTIVDVFTDGTGLVWVESLLELFASVLDTIYLIADAINTAWNKDNNGYKFVKSILTMWTSIQDLVRSIIDSWNRAWSSGVGVSIVERVLHIFTNINLTVKALADNLKKAWEENGNGQAIFETILGVVDDILADIEDCSRYTKEWAENLHFEPLISKIRELFDKLRPVIQDISHILKDLYKLILLVAKIEIEFAIPVGLQVLADIIDDLHRGLSPVIRLLDKLTDKLEKLTGLDFSSDKHNVLAEIVSWYERLTIMNTLPKPIQWLIQLGDLIEKLQRIDWKKLWNDILHPDQKGMSEAEKGYSQANSKSVWEELGDGLIKGLTSPFENFDIVQWCKDHIVQPIKDFFGIHSPSKLMKEIGQDIILGLWEGMLKLLNKMQIKLPKQVEFIATAFGGVAVAVANNWDKIKEGAGEMVDKTKEKIQSIPSYFKEKFNSAYQGATKAFSTIGTYFQNKNTEIQNGFSNLPTLLTTTAKTAYTGITGAFSGLGTFMKDTATTAYNNLTGAFSGTSKAFQGVSNSITTAMTGAWNSFNNQWNANTAGNKMNDVANKMKQPFSGFAKFIGDELGGAWNKITNAFKDAGNAFGGTGSSVYNSLKSMVNALIDKMNSAINQIVNGVNHIIDQLATSLKKQGFSVPNIKKVQAKGATHLATGAVIPPNHEFLAVLGDQKRGTNIETPLDTMIDAFRTALREDGGGASNNAPIVLQLNGRTVAEAVWDETEKRYKQKGISGAFAY